MGLGNISISENYPEVSKDEMLAKLDVLKEPFLNNFNPDIKERIDRIKGVQALVEENFDEFHGTGSVTLRESVGGTPSLPRHPPVTPQIAGAPPKILPVLFPSS